MALELHAKEYTLYPHKNRDNSLLSELHLLCGYGRDQTQRSLTFPPHEHRQYQNEQAHKKSNHQRSENPKKKEKKVATLQAQPNHGTGDQRTGEVRISLRSVKLCRENSNTVQHLAHHRQLGIYRI